VSVIALNVSPSASSASIAASSDSGITITATGDRTPLRRKATSASTSSPAAISAAIPRLPSASSM
jgi:hypothetical protein